MNEDMTQALLPAPADADSVREARSLLRLLLQRAYERSQALGASRLLVEAAESDLDEARAERLPSATLGLGAAALGQHQGDVHVNAQQAQANVQLGAPLWDAGRNAALTRGRERLLQAARQGDREAREQVALQTVSLALERERFGLQAEAYGRQAARMSCLIGGLEQIVAADRGRASELLQVRNTLRQVTLAQSQAQSQQRQVEIRLRHFVGTDPLPQAPLHALLREPPALERLLDDASHAGVILQLAAQLEAQENLVEVQRAEHRPQLSWSVGSSQIAGGGSRWAWSGGMQLSVPLLDPTAKPAIRASEQRTEALRAQRDEALRARLNQVMATREQADAAFERARLSVEALEGSGAVRQATLKQWQQLGRRSLFDVISAENDYHGLLVTHINAVMDAQQSTALLWSLGPGVAAAANED
ncbi:MAG TPA: TolC family protein [Burkholderiaceae bacterium]|nr:TolC family protein [Burkholderiaceae bacterium]